MSTVDIFGPLITADQLEQAAIDTLELWFQDYLTSYELNTGLIPNTAAELKHPLPNSYLVANQLDAQTRDMAMLPAIVVVSPGMSSRTSPRQEGDGSFRGFFSLAVGVFASGPDRGSTMKLIRLYAALVRAIMLQKQALGGFADGTQWLDESYNDSFPFTDDQTISAGQVVFDVEVSDIVNRYAGVAGTTPPAPLTDPGSQWPLADTVLATVSPMEET